jgi:hypothetical protein
MPDELIFPNLSIKEVQAMQQPLAMDLTAAYAVMRDDAMDMVERAEKEGWTPDDLVAHLTTLFGTEAVAPAVMQEQVIEAVRFVEKAKLQGRREFQGLPISIENRKGSIREGEDADGSEWRTKMTHPYGYIRTTEGVDGDQVDCFMGPNKDAENAFIIECMNPETGKYDEDKVMLGFDGSELAKQAFLENYDDARFMGPIHEVSMDGLLDLLKARKGHKLITKDWATPRQALPSTETVKVSDEGEIGPYTIYIVDDKLVTTMFDPDWAGGSNHMGKPYTPDWEIWIGDSIADDEKDEYTEHEILEDIEMRYNSHSYDEAHSLATLPEMVSRLAEVESGKRQGLENLIPDVFGLREREQKRTVAAAMRQPIDRLILRAQLMPLYNAALEGEMIYKGHAIAIGDTVRWGKYISVRIKKTDGKWNDYKKIGIAPEGWKRGDPIPKEMRAEHQKTLHELGNMTGEDIEAPPGEGEAERILRRRGNAKRQEQEKGEPQRFYHGTTASFEDFKPGEPVYLAPHQSAAQGFANDPLAAGHAGGKGKPKVLAVDAKPGKVQDIDEEVLQALDEGEGPDDIIKRMMPQFKKDGVRYVEFDHPGPGGAEDFRARVSLFPEEDLVIVREENENREKLINAIKDEFPDKAKREKAIDNLDDEQIDALVKINHGTPDKDEILAAIEFAKRDKKEKEPLQETAPEREAENPVIEHQRNRGTIGRKKFLELLDAGKMLRPQAEGLILRHIRLQKHAFAADPAWQERIARRMRGMDNDALAEYAKVVGLFGGEGRTPANEVWHIGDMPPEIKENLLRGIALPENMEEFEMLIREGPHSAGRGKLIALHDLAWPDQAEGFRARINEGMEPGEMMAVAEKAFKQMAEMKPPPLIGPAPAPAEIARLIPNINHEGSMHHRVDGWWKKVNGKWVRVPAPRKGDPHFGKPIIGRGKREAAAIAAQALPEGKPNPRHTAPAGWEKMSWDKKVVADKNRFADEVLEARRVRRGSAGVHPTVRDRYRGYSAEHLLERAKIYLKSDPNTPKGEEKRKMEIRLAAPWVAPEHPLRAIHALEQQPDSEHIKGMQTGKASGRMHLGGGINASYVADIEVEGKKVKVAWKPGVASDAAHEKGAYLVDRAIGLNRVPNVIVRAIEWKNKVGPEKHENGSAMEFAIGAQTAGSVGQWKTKCSMDEKMRCATFDFLITHTDRHTGNFMLYPDGKIALIDNGYAWSGRGGKTMSYIWEAIGKSFQVPPDLLENMRKTDLPKLVSDLKDAGLSKGEILRFQSKFNDVIKNGVITHDMDRRVA